MNMDHLELFFPGQPRAIQSCRFANRGGFVQRYQPKANTDWKGYIRLRALDQLPDTWSLLDCPIGITAAFCFSPPLSTRKRDLQAMKDGATMYKTTKPDLTDNLCKGLIDALTGVVWRDDALICRVETVKRFDFMPGIQLTVDTLSPLLYPLGV